MPAFQYRMPNGIPGDVTRQSQSTIESQNRDPANAFTAYGRFGKIASGRFVPIGAGDAATAIYGLLIRPFPTQGANASDPLGVSVPANGAGMHDVLRRGYANVQVNFGTAALNGPVYIRVANPLAGRPIGGIEASSSADTITVPNCIFMSAADASGNAEIAFNI